MSNTQKIYVACQRGIVSPAIVRKLRQNGVSPVSLVYKSPAEIDDTNQAALQTFLVTEQSKQVYLAVAKVGNASEVADKIYTRDLLATIDQT